MNKEILKDCGFNKEVELIDNGKCPFCGKSININDFRDGLSRKEFKISGICQKCQDETFK